MFRSLVSSIIRFVSGQNAAQESRRRSRPLFHSSTDCLEDRVLLAADVLLWTDGGATPDFDIAANWTPHQRPDSQDTTNFVTSGQAHVFGATASLLLAVILSLMATNAASAAEKPVRARKPARLVTYRFTARITDNAGVTPFKFGSKITGEFTYDLTAKNTKNVPKDLGPKFARRGRYLSNKNRIVFKYGKLRIESTGIVVVNTGTVPGIAESFNMVASNVVLPKGWKIIEPRDRKERSRAFGIIFQNYPPRGVLPSAHLPKDLDLSKFSNVKNMFLDFFHGVAFPGGAVSRRAKVEAEIQELERVSKNGTTKP
jgi:hypothetical protein